MLEALAEVSPGKPTELVFGRADGSTFGRTTARRMLERAAKHAGLFEEHMKFAKVEF